MGGSAKKIKKVFKASSTKDKIGGLLSGSLADPLDLSGHQSKILAKADAEDAKKAEKKAQDIARQQEQTRQQEQAAALKKDLDSLMRRRRGNEGLLFGGQYDTSSNNKTTLG